MALADQGLVEHSLNGRVIRVERQQVAAIRETYDAFRLTLTQGARFVTLRKRLEAVDVVRKRLTQWQTIRPSRGILGLVGNAGTASIAVLVVIALQGIGLETQDIWVLMGCLAGSWVLVALGVVLVRRNVSTRISEKVLATVAFASPLTLLLRMIYKLASV